MDTAHSPEQIKRPARKRAAITRDRRHAPPIAWFALIYVVTDDATPRLAFLCG